MPGGAPLRRDRPHDVHGRTARTMLPTRCTKGSGSADRIGLQSTDDLLRAVNYPRLHTSPDPMRLASCAEKTSCTDPRSDGRMIASLKPAAVSPAFQHMY